MAIAFDNAVNAAAESSGLTTLETASGAFAATGAAVAFVASGAGTPSDPVSLRWGGAAGDLLTQQGATLLHASNIKLSRFFLVPPAAATRTGYCTWGSADDEKTFAILNYTGVDQVTPLRTSPTPTTGAGGTPSITATTVAGDMVVACLWTLDTGGSSGTVTSTGGQTNRVVYEGGVPFAYEQLSVDEKLATTTSTTLSWSMSATTASWVIMAFVLREGSGAPAGGTETQNFRRDRPGRGPYSLGRYYRPRVDAFTLTDVTRALTGQAITSAQGTLTPARSIGLTGGSITSGQGTVTPALSKALTGSAITSVQGTITPSLSISISGSGITSSQGTVSAGNDITVALTGQAITSALGSVSPATALVLSGQAITIGQGSVAQSLSVPLTSQFVSLGQGSVTAPGNVSVALTGQTITASLGSLSPDSSKALSGQSSTVYQGSIAYGGLSITITGQSITTAQGTVIGDGDPVPTVDVRQTFGVAIRDRSRFKAKKLH
jgi:hypothetical protein